MLFTRREVSILAVLAISCGGKVVFDTDGSGGAGAAGSTVGVTIAATTKAAGVTGATTGAGGSCPTDPVDGEPCSNPGLLCLLPSECCSPTATCVNGSWSISQPGCGSLCIPCGPDIECAASAVCVTLQIDENLVHQCRPNPCGTQQLSCMCAAPLCANDVTGKCVSAQDSQVTCETFTN